MMHQIIETIKQAKSIGILTHVNPDGDAIGSTVALFHLCKALQKEAIILMEEIPSSFTCLLEDVRIVQDFDEPLDVIIVADCGDLKRLGQYEQYFYQAKYTVNIDHHYTNTHFATYNEVDDNGSSTCEQVFRLIETSQIPLTLHIIQALYVGIVTDTGGFMHSCTHPSTHKIVAKLLEMPFDFTKLYHQFIHEKTEKTIALETKAYEHLEKLDNNRIFLSYLNSDDFKQLSATHEDASSVIQFIKNIKGCELAALLYSTEQESYKLSMRSNECYDVAKIAKVFGGGGHKRAAGATIEGTLEQIKELVKAQLLNKGQEKEQC